MRRPVKIALITVGSLLALPIVAAGALFFALNTAPGRGFALGQLASLTHGQVALTGLTGRFPDQLRLAHAELRDTQGAWLTADDIVLDWSPLALLHRQALVDDLQVARLEVRRLPAPGPDAMPAPAQADAKPFQLPVQVTVRHLAIPRATIVPYVGGATLALEGQAELATLQSGTAELRITRQDSPGTYTLSGALTPTRIDAHLAIAEPEGGLVAQLASLPAIGPLTLKADLAGPKAALATTLALTAGPSSAGAHGTVDLEHATVALDVQADAPAMRPAPGVAWGAITLAAHVAGPFTAPNATGRLRVDRLEAQGAGLETLAADLSGNAGQVTLHAVATALRLPGPNPTLLAAAPLTLDAAIRLDDPARPVTYRLVHPLLSLAGTARTAAPLSADATLTLPDLVPFAALGNVAAGGRTTLAIRVAQPSQGQTDIGVDGTLALTAGPAPAPALIGGDAHIALAASLAGPVVTLRSARVRGAAIALDAAGAYGPAGIDATVKLALANLALLAPTLTGAATIDAHAHGPLDGFALETHLAGTVGAPGLPPGPLTLDAALTGLPSAPGGRVTGSGMLENSPVDLVLDARRDTAGTLRATIEKAEWRSLHAEGALTLPPGTTLPQGRVSIRFGQLADLRPFVGQPLGGALTATLVLDPGGATLEADLQNAGLPGTKVAHAHLKAQATDPLTRPVLAATLALDGIEADGTAGTARLEASGPQDALALRATASVTASGTPAKVSLAALLDLPAKHLRVTTLDATASPAALDRPVAVRLLAPATLSFAEGLAVDRLRLDIDRATLDVAGRLTPTLDATIALKADAALLPLPRGEGPGPTAQYDGAISLDARLSGTPAAPSGTVRLTATRLHARSGPASAFPPATLAGTVQLGNRTARIDARLTGPATLAVTGTAPFGPGALALRANGVLDLALLDPLLTAQGRRARGRVTVDASIGGTAASPQVGGTIQLANGELQDFTQNIHLTELAATLRAEGQSLRIVSLTGRAGPGTIGASGSIGLLAPGRPVALMITARNARPLASDTIGATLDADLTLSGTLDALKAGGRVLIRQADLGIPDALPASVAVLPIRRPGDKPPAPPSAASAPIALDLVIDAPGRIFVRGRGIDAEMSGALKIRGTSTAPQVTGGLEMRRGTISVAGTNLTFSHGRVGFDGTGLGGRIDPTLDFAADSTSTGVTATLAIGGYVSKPTITLRSTPDLPQDEVLAYLLFKRSAKDLGPFQLASIAAGIAQLTGVGGSGGFNPLETVRKGLGLDRLSIGSSSTTGSTSAANSSTPTLEAGRYVANGVYVGAKQGTSGSQTQATVQIDITKGLKLETDVGTGQGGNQVGLTYQFEY